MHDGAGDTVEAPVASLHDGAEGGAVALARHLHEFHVVERSDVHIRGDGWLHRDILSKSNFPDR